MPTIIESQKKDFVPHPEGTFIAICRDTYLQTKPNPWKGNTNEKGEVDGRETITELVLEFLTEHAVEVNGSLEPAFTRFVATASTAENSNLRKFLKGWFPALKDENFKRFDADGLIGRGAYLTIAHNASKKTGNVYANVIGAMQPPKGASLPMIPKDFIRKVEREELAKASETAPEQPAHIDDGDVWNGQAPPF